MQGKWLAHSGNTYRPPKPRVVGSIPASRAIPHQVLASKTLTERQPTGLAFLFLVFGWSQVGLTGSDLWKVDVRLRPGAAPHPERTGVCSRLY